MNVVHGWRFPDADRFMANEMKADGSYQAGHLTEALKHVRDFSIAVDGGAHVGTWSRLMSKSFDRVIAVEPSEDTFEALSVNMATFGCDNVELKRCAIGAEVGLVSMALDGRAAAMHNTGGRFVQQGGDIPVERIDDWELPSCGFIKLDIEGSEPLALQGARETLERCQPIVLFEHKGFCVRYGLPKDAVLRLLTKVGYVHLATTGKDQIWGPR